MVDFCAPKYWKLMYVQSSEHNSEVGMLGFVTQIDLQTKFPLPMMDLSCGVCDRCAKRGVAVEDHSSDLNSGGPSVKVSCHQELAERFHAVHFALDAASAVVSAPASPDGPAEVSR